MTDTPARRQDRPVSRKPDVVGLVMGSLISVVAAGTLFVGFGGDVHGPWLKAALPVVLIIIGGAGLLLSRGRDQ